jgi:hypothetical protein
MCWLALGLAQGAEKSAGTIEKENFRLTYDERGITGLANPHDPFGAEMIPQGQRLGLTVKYKSEGGEWRDVTGYAKSSADEASVTYTNGASDSSLKVTQSFKTDGKALDWDIAIDAATNAEVEIGDLAINIPVVGPRGEEPKEIFEHGFLKHQFISGNGSFIYFVRASGVPPFLIVTVKPGTKLEYFAGGFGRGGAQVFVHSGLSGGNEKRGTWRQAHTLLKLGAAGSQSNHDTASGARTFLSAASVEHSNAAGISTAAEPSKVAADRNVRAPTVPGQVSYGFRFRWAKSYDDMREILFDEGLFDIRAVPGMTIPEDLTAKFSLHTKAKIESIDAEFPLQTKITKVGEPQRDVQVYEVAFKRLGENMLTIHHDRGRKTYLEYFVTEPLETLIKKRASFIVNRQQIRDSSKWWDGVFGPYDMKNRVVRTIDDPDIFLGRMVYTLTCDDPGLSKAPYVAEKNVSFPEKKEIEGLEYYLEHFVWGKLQRTEKEQPYPYGVYGTPNWYVDREPARRRAWALGSTRNPNGSSAAILASGATNLQSVASRTNSTGFRDLNKEHVWRSYDYPHVVMFYFHMYEIAKKYPAMSKYLDAAGHLERAYQTAHAFFTYPYEIYPSYYETYKWGLYNELIILKLADALEREGLAERAAWLRSEWEKKVKYFVYDDQYPFRSEYAFDRTAFESSYAFAKYGATHDMQPDTNLWYDVKLKKSYSHPSVKREDSRDFMERQLAAGLCVRGWLETSYYQLGADPGLSYMAAMGGWGIFDYAVNFAERPSDWLQLGYASYLSTWCLVNSGRAENNFGFWFPGKENDGAAGWQFMSAKVGNAWMGSSYPGGVMEPRGPWHYDGEIDLGFGGALRMSATVLTYDPIFGWFAYGGALRDEQNTLRIVPRDGLRQRFYAILSELENANSPVRRFKMELDRDGFVAGDNIVTDKSLSKIAFTLENRTGDEHTTELLLSLPAAGSYSVLQNGKAVQLSRTGNWDYPFRAELRVTLQPCRVEIVRAGR